MPGGRATAIVILVLVVALVVARIVFASRLGIDELEAQRRRARGRAIDPLLEADQLAAAGRFADAAHALYRGVVERLARTDGLRLHRSKTSGDYARELRRAGSARHAPFMTFRKLYDRILYGYAECDGDAYAVLREHALVVVQRERAA